MSEQVLVERKRTSGRVRYVLTEAGLECVERLASLGNHQRTIAKALGMPWSTFRDMRDREVPVQEALARGLGSLSDELTHHLLTAARNGHVVAAIYLTKSRLGWVEGQPPEGAPKTAVQVNINIPRAMTDAEFQRVIAAPNPREGGYSPAPSDDAVRAR